MSEALSHLALVGVHADTDDAVLLYHATRSQHVDVIMDAKSLRPAVPSDPGERQLRRGRGAIYLSSSPAIGEDMHVGPVLALRVVASELATAEVIRSGYGDPPRVELEVWRDPDDPLPLVAVERYQAAVARSDLPCPVQAAIAAYETAPVGRQLSDPAERRGRCWRSATRFLAALREHGADGELLGWAADDWTHGAIRPLETPVVVDWTLSQFETDPEKAQTMEFPVICTPAEVDALVRATREILKFEGGSLFRTDDLLPEPVLPWVQAREPIVERDRHAR